MKSQLKANYKSKMSNMSVMKVPTISIMLFKYYDTQFYFDSIINYFLTINFICPVEQRQVQWNSTKIIFGCTTLRKWCTVCAFNSLYNCTSSQSSTKGK